MSDTKHPMQPTVKDADGVICFKENKLVSFLYNECQSHSTPTDNIIKRFHELEVNINDREQFKQLIGHTVEDYNIFLSVSDESKELANIMALPQNVGKTEVRIQNEFLVNELRKIKIETAKAMIKVFDIDIRVEPT